MRKLVVDKNKCIGCGTCIALCPGVFKLDKDSKAKVKPIAKDQTCIQEAIDSCPVQAINWE